MTEIDSVPNELTEIQGEVRKREVYHLSLLSEAVQISFSDLVSFQSWVGQKMKGIGLQIDEFTVDRDELADQPAYQKTLRENPTALKSGPNIVGRSSAEKHDGGILLFAHADKFPQTFEWGKKHPHMTERNGKLFAPGIADDVSGVTAMLSAIETFYRLRFEQKRNLMVASVLGKQLGVFGTYGLMKRYKPMDAVIYVHPAESGCGLNEIHMASNGMIEFSIEIEGKAPGTTDPFQTVYAKSAVNAAEKGVYLFQGLQTWAMESSKRYHHSNLQELVGQSVSLVVSRFNAGVENQVYEIPLRGILEGTVCFPPLLALKTVQSDFKETFERLVKQDPWLAQSHVRLEWGDLIGDSAQSEERSTFLQTTSQVLAEVTGKKPHYQYGYSLSDIRYPLLSWKAESLGFGPVCGDINKETEWVDRKEYLDSIVALTLILKQVL